MGLEKAHWDLQIFPDEFDAVVEEFSHAFDYYSVLKRGKKKS